MSDFITIPTRTLPGNFGPFNGANGNARIKGPCGDTMEFWVLISEGVILAVTFTTDGCRNSIKCGMTAAAMADWKKRNHATIRTGQKTSVSARSIIQPRPQLLVSCRGKDGTDNALVVVYAGNCSYDPPMVMIGIVPTRYSCDLVKESGCFVVNLVSPAQKEMYDYLGSHSGRDENKLAAIGAKTANGLRVNAPILTDCPINIECTVVDSIRTGSHETFIGKIEYVHADAEIVKEDGTVDWDRCALL